MDVIIHGKPLDSSERFTTGIDKVLARKIIDEFFSISAIKEPEALVVDARYWQGKWTSVYTLYLSQNVKDTAGRGSYFAISLVLPQKYCGIVSDVYTLLEKVVNENVIGTYLNSNLQYIVRNFEIPAAFDQLCAKVQSCYANIEKAFDKDFKAQPLFSNDTYCNLEDCDSLAFVKLLKKKGRIIVTEKEDTKDALITKSYGYKIDADNKTREVKEKTAEIDSLNDRINKLERQVRDASSTSSRELTDLKGKVDSLKRENETLKQEKDATNSQLVEIRKKITQAVEILGLPDLQQRKQPSPALALSDLKSKSEPGQNNFRIIKILPAVNTLFIMLIAIGLLANTKGCSGNDKAVQEAAEAKAKIETLNEQMQQKDQQIATLQKQGLHRNDVIPASCMASRRSSK